MTAFSVSRDAERSARALALRSASRLTGPRAPLRVAAARGPALRSASRLYGPLNARCSKPFRSRFAGRGSRETSGRGSDRRWAEVQTGSNLAQLVVHVPQQRRLFGILHEVGRLAVQPARSDDVMRVDPVDVADPAVDEVAVLTGGLAAPNGGSEPRLEFRQTPIRPVDDPAPADAGNRPADFGMGEQLVELTAAEVLQVVQTSRGPESSWLAPAGQPGAEQKANRQDEGAQHFRRGDEIIGASRGEEARSAWTKALARRQRQGKPFPFTLFGSGSSRLEPGLGRASRTNSAAPSRSRKPAKAGDHLDCQRVQASPGRSTRNCTSRCFVTSVT